MNRFAAPPAASKSTRWLVIELGGARSFSNVANRSHLAPLAAHSALGACGRAATLARGVFSTFCRGQTLRVHSSPLLEPGRLAAGFGLSAGASHTLVRPVRLRCGRSIYTSGLESQWSAKANAAAAAAAATTTTTTTTANSTATTANAATTSSTSSGASSGSGGQAEANSDYTQRWRGPGEHSDSERPDTARQRRRRRDWRRHRKDADADGEIDGDGGGGDDDLLGRTNSSLLNGFGRDCGPEERRASEEEEEDDDEEEEEEEEDVSERSGGERNGKSARLAADEFEWRRVELRQRRDSQRDESAASKHVPKADCRAKLEHAAELYADSNHYLESRLPFATAQSIVQQNLTLANINKQLNYDQAHYQHNHQQHYQQLRRQPNSFELAHMQQLSQQPNQPQHQQYQHQPQHHQQLSQLHSQRLPQPPRGFGQADDENNRDDDELVAMETAAAATNGLPAVEYADPHLYCAVTSGGGGGTLRPPPRQQVPARVPQNQALQQHYFQYQPRQLLHKSPTSLTLNHSYQTLVEKLNETRYSQPMQTHRALNQHHHQQQQFYLTHHSQSPPFHLNQQQQQHHLPAGLAQINCFAATSPVFSSLNTNGSAATTPPNSATQQDLLRAKTGLADGSNRHRKYHFERADRARWWQVGWSRAATHKRLRSPWCGLGRLLLLLLAGLLLLASIFLVPIWRSDEMPARHDNQRELMRKTESDLVSGMDHYQSAPPGGASPNQHGQGRAQVPSGTLLPIERLFGPIFQQPPQATVIKGAANSGHVNDLTKWPPGMTNVATSPSSLAPQSAPISTTSSPSQVELMASSTQSYWRLGDHFGGPSQASPLINFCGLSSSSGGLIPSECNGNGKCDSSSGMCSCLPGFSGPTCATAQCPNGCLGRGQCKLRRDWPLNELHKRQLDSIGFQSAGWARWRLSACADPDDPIGAMDGNRTGSWLQRSFASASEGNHEASGRSSNDDNKLFDNRLQWHCECQPEWTGADCSQERELNCSDQLDNDQDGLADCEDDDCCAQPICRDNLMCYKPPEPQAVLGQLRSTDSRVRELEIELNSSSPTDSIRGRRLFAQWQFLIEPNSIQSYAKREAFDRARVAVIRGRVLAQGSGVLQLNNQLAGIVSVRVSVLENASFGFTLTRQDGHFDLLVNGNEWLTLQFHRNAYAPIKRRIFVRPHAINVLEADVLIGLARRDETSGAIGGGGGGGGGGGASEQVERQDHEPNRPQPFGLGLVFELRHLVEQHQRQANSGRQRDDERARAALFECLLNEAQRRYFIQSGLSNGLPTDSQLEPEIVQLGTNRSSSLRLFALASPGSTAFATSLRGGGGGGSGQEVGNSSLGLDELEILYNSAAFPSAASVAKPVVVLQLLPDDFEARQQRLASSGQAYFKLEAVNIQLNIEGQSRRERLQPVNGLSYQFAWNRRNVYGQKVYGFSDLSIRVDYELQLASTISSRSRQPTDASQALSAAGCLESTREIGGSSGEHLRRHSLEAALTALADRELRRRTRSFVGRIHVEAHQLNQHADIGRWSLAASARFDAERQSIYFGTGWTLPLELVYPPVVSEPFPILARPQLGADRAGHANSPGRRLMTKGPNSSLFMALVGDSKRLVQVDATGSRRLIDLPLAMLMGKFQPQPNSNASAEPNSEEQNLELLYNNFESALYISSRQAAKLVRVSLASLMALNKTLSSPSPPSQASIELDDVLELESVCGFGRAGFGSAAPSRVQLCKSRWLTGPHSMTLDEHRQVLYFVDGRNSLLALDLATNYVFDLLAAEPTDASGSSTQQHQVDAQGGGCLSAGSKLMPPQSLVFLREQRRLHSLAWSRVDSSLYLTLDSNAIAALRPDLSIEIIALASSQAATHLSQTSSSASRLFGHDTSSQGRHQLPAALCSSGPERKTGGPDERQLGSIRDILLDDGANGLELLVLHQWRPAESWIESDRAKRADRLYLAKLALGVKSRHSSEPKVFDLHSAKSTWDPLIWAARGASETSKPIDWSRLAERGHQPEKIPFIHLMDDGGGFERADAIQINAEGKMFVLNLMDQTIRTIGAYSPKQFNQVKRNDLTLDKLLATPPSAGGPLATSSRFEGLSLISLRNPMRANEVLSFHSESGLLVGLTQSGSESVNLEFSYKILPNNINQVRAAAFQTNLEDQIEFGSQPRLGDINNLNHDDVNNEDDQSDLDIRRLIRQYVSQFNANRTSQLMAASRGYIRLNSIVDLRRGEQLQFVRKFSNNQFVLQSIVLNDRPICTLNTDLSGVLTKFIQQPTATKSRWVELVYDPKTYLLRNVITKTSTPTSHHLQTSTLYQPQTNVMLQTTFPYDDKLTRSTKRIIYDEIFNHYCDLFIVDA